MAAGFGIGDILAGKQGDNDDYYHILGCSESSSPEQITCEYRIRALKCHPDKHPNDERALEMFQKLQEARDTLLDAEKRQKYDRWKQSEMCMSYKQWLGMNNRCATTMHWAKPKDSTMIESGLDIKRHEMKKEFDKSTSDTEVFKNEMPGENQSVADVKWAQTNQEYLWQPENASNVYAKFRNYKI